MKQFKRITGLFLAVLMVVGMLPIHVVADTVTYTGIDVHMYNTIIGEKVQNAQANIQFATDALSEQYQSDSTVTIQGKWYHTVDSEQDVPVGQETEYEPLAYDTFNVYAREVKTDETFVENEHYLYVATLTPTVGMFDEYAIFGPIGKVYANIQTNEAAVYVPVTPTTERNIAPIEFTCNNVGEVSIKNPNSSWMYLYSLDSGETIQDGLAGQPIGKYVVSNALYPELKGTIDVTNRPVVTLYAVDKNEWMDGNTSAVVGHGTYTIPMSDPYITVDTLEFGESLNVTEIGTSTGGAYHWNIAHASFLGWFTDKEGTNPATVEADSYAIFTIRSYGLFTDGIKAEDFKLKCREELYDGAHILNVDSNAYTVAFLVPSNRIRFTLEVIGTGGTMQFMEYPEYSSISLKPLPSGAYNKQDIRIAIEPGYYVKSLKVNGEVWDDIRNPFLAGSKVYIMNDEAFTTGIASFEPTGNTVISMEVASADRITIEYGDNYAVYTGRYADETQWHANAQYWVSETYLTNLCSNSALIDGDNLQHLKGLNTKADGSGTYVPIQNGQFYWEPLAEYVNGTQDEITLYAIMECNAHTEYGAEDNAWEYRNAQNASCTEEGWLAHRYCPNCGQYQVQNEGVYVATTKSAITLDKLPHTYTVYTELSDTEHDVKCKDCTDHYTEKHTLDNGQCVCGYRQYVPGDMNEDGIVTDADAYYLLLYTIFPDDYPIYQPADMNGDGAVTDADAYYLLLYTIFPDDYPLN